MITFLGYADIEEKRKAKGFTNDQESGVICRYKIQGVIVDIMPTSKKILGFSNRWYIPGFANSIDYKLNDTYIIKIFSPGYFLAAKLEAFKNRGQSNGITSKDFEDIVFILNNRSTIWEEIREAENHVKSYIITAFQNFLQIKYYNEWISVHLEYTQQERQYFIIDSIKEIAFG